MQIRMGTWLLATALGLLAACGDGGGPKCRGESCAPACTTDCAPVCAERCGTRTVLSAMCGIDGCSCSCSNNDGG